MEAQGALLFASNEHTCATDFSAKRPYVRTFHSRYLHNYFQTIVPATGHLSILASSLGKMLTNLTVDDSPYP